MRTKELLLITVMLAGCASQSTAPTAHPKMPDSSYLDDATRAKIRGAMATHGGNMGGMMWATVFVDIDSVADHAEAIAKGPQVERYDPSTPKDERPNLPKDELLPDYVIDLQQKMVEKAKVVHDLARSTETVTPEQLGQAYGELVSVCITCHAHYRYPEAQITRSK